MMMMPHPSIYIIIILYHKKKNTSYVLCIQTNEIIFAINQRLGLHD